MGPAVLTSIIMASQGAAGSQVIICTDGEANYGMGRFGSSPESNEKASNRKSSTVKKSTTNQTKGNIFSQFAINNNC